jgi:hypothetical protein
VASASVAAPTMAATKRLICRSAIDFATNIFTSGVRQRNPAVQLLRACQRHASTAQGRRCGNGLTTVTGGSATRPRTVRTRSNKASADVGG